VDISFRAFILSLATAEEEDAAVAIERDTKHRRKQLASKIPMNIQQQCEVGDDDTNMRAEREREREREKECMDVREMQAGEGGRFTYIGLPSLLCPSYACEHANTQLDQARDHVR
jgi:hypothetical protein